MRNTSYERPEITIVDEELKLPEHVRGRLNQAIRIVHGAAASLTSIDDVIKLNVENRVEDENYVVSTQTVDELQLSLGLTKKQATVVAGGVDAQQHGGTAKAIEYGLLTAALAIETSLHGSNTFANIRPPGHHAGIHGSSGFCHRNNALICAVYYLLSKTYGETPVDDGAITKVVIVDVDHHHGGGAEQILQSKYMIDWLSHNGMAITYVTLNADSAEGVFDNPFGGHTLGKLLPQSKKAALERDFHRLRASYDYDTPEMVKEKLVKNIAYMEKLFGERQYDAMVVSAGFDCSQPETIGSAVHRNQYTPRDLFTLGAALNDLANTHVTTRSCTAILEGGYERETLTTYVPAFFDGLHNGNGNLERYRDDDVFVKVFKTPPKVTTRGSRKKKKTPAKKKTKKTSSVTADEFEIDEVLNIRMLPGKNNYEMLVSWVGHDEGGNTWEKPDVSDKAGTKKMNTFRRKLKTMPMVVTGIVSSNSDMFMVSLNGQDPEKMLYKNINPTAMDNFSKNVHRYGRRNV
jgi:acetoin utilization deacetylase AcuC-like enzyme